MSDNVLMRPIGFVRSPYSETAQVPKGFGAQHEAEGTIEILPEYELRLTDIDGFSHLYVIWVFDRSDGCELLGTPPTDPQPPGVFDPRAPPPPNPSRTVFPPPVRRDDRILSV